MVFQMPIKSILYVCTGNVFRSPFAERITKKLLGNSSIKVESAGILEYRGQPLPQEIVEVARKYGVDLSRHKPRQVNVSLVEAADLILVFDKKQVAELEGMFPKTKAKILTIKNCAGFSDDRDMEDLWEKPVEVFERSIREIEVYVRRCVDRILQQQDGKDSWAAEVRPQKR